MSKLAMSWSRADCAVLDLLTFSWHMHRGGMSFVIAGCQLCAIVPHPRCRQSVSGARSGRLGAELCATW